MGTFEYFPNFPEGAQLRPEACGYCGRSPAIPAERLMFNPGNAGPKVVCADCLQEGKARVRIPQWIERELWQAIGQVHPDWNPTQRAELVAIRLSKLAHTPPIPWLQSNEWPICGDDFARYGGELTREHLLHEHDNAALAKEALRAIIEEVRPEWELTTEDMETAWEQLGNFVAIFLFRCPGDPRTTYVLQTA